MPHKRLQVIVALSAVVVFALWYAFRPEKLFINKKVNEVAPITSFEGPKLISTTKLTSEQKTAIGRASIYMFQNGSHELRVTNLSTLNAPDLHVVLLANKSSALSARKAPISLQNSIDLGLLKAVHGNQDIPLPAYSDLTTNNVVAIYGSRSQAILAAGTLESY